MIDGILECLKLAEGLKRELRHSWLSDGRRESVAEHSYQMALMALLFAPYLEHPVNVERAMSMVLVHDLVEALAGDIPFFETGERQDAKAARERDAIERIRDLLPEPVGVKVFELWHEFEALETPEAKFVKALDQLEVQLQHNIAGLETWEPIEYDLVYTKMDRHCAHDETLKTACSAIKREAETKLRNGGIDVEAIKLRLSRV